jgi:hypothetical protein
MSPQSTPDTPQARRRTPRPVARVEVESFEDSERLRALLTRLHDGGPDAWNRDPQVPALMAFAARKYAALAKKHGLDPWELATAAFHAMRGAATRNADDPWAVITRAVQITGIAEERGQGLLCSTHQARRPRYSAHHDPERFSDRENPLTDYHPAFHTNPFTSLDEADDVQAPASALEPVIDVDAAIWLTVRFFTLVGWRHETAQAAVEYVRTRLAQLPSRASAYEVLRREPQARAVVDIPTASWTALLRIVLGNPDPALASTSAGRGVLMRLLIGESVRSLLMDEDLVLAASLAAPSSTDHRGTDHRGTDHGGKARR